LGIFQKLFGSEEKRPLTEERVSLESPNTPLTGAVLDNIYAPNASSGANINIGSALSLSAFWRAINIISDTLASLPLNVVDLDSEGNAKINKNHPSYWLIHSEPNELYTKYQLIKTWVTHTAVFGNGYIVIKRGQDGRPQKLTLVSDPSRVQAYMNGSDQLYYMISGMNRPYRSDEILHLYNFSWNGVGGLFMLDIHRDTLGLALSNREVANKYYKNGAHTDKWLKYPGKLSNDAYLRLKNSFNRAYSGASNAGTIPILEEGGELKAIGATPKESSHVETAKLTISDVARITGVPQFMLEDLDRATFNNIEHMTLQFVKHTIRPWCKNIEAELDRKLFLETEKGDVAARFNLDDLLMADTENRAEYHYKLFQIGAMSPNDIRKAEGKTPIAEGDRYYRPLNMVELGQTPEQNITPDEEE
jgi:HK97 family phage portal protein